MTPEHLGVQQQVVKMRNGIRPQVIQQLLQLLKIESPPQKNSFSLFFIAENWIYFNDLLEISFQSVCQHYRCYGVAHVFSDSDLKTKTSEQCIPHITMPRKLMTACRKQFLRGNSFNYIFCCVLEISPAVVVQNPDGRILGAN